MTNGIVFIIAPVVIYKEKNRQTQRIIYFSQITVDKKRR